MDMADATCLPYDEHRLVSCGVSGGALSLLVEQGLPADCNRMFVRDPDKELSVPMAFSDEDFWWSRVLEEVELGGLVPEQT